MGLSRITLRLARNPGTAFPDGDDHRGYSLVAPLDSSGFIDEAGWRDNKEACTVRHFSPDLPSPRVGRLSRRGDNWFFDYDSSSTEDDEPVFKLGLHRFAPGEYVTIRDEDDVAMTYQVREVVHA
ncbi:hypothetical protein GC169_07780 [bacterium]|nr:hypothetical protein [bacterium]